MLPLWIALAPFLAQEPAPTLVLRNARVFDPAAMELRAAADLWIGGERVIGERPLGAAVDVGVGEGPEVIDAGGATLLPGMFDLHVHVAAPGSGMDAFVRLAREDNLRSQLACGVTHVVDLHDDPGAVFALRERSRTAPDLARLHCVGAAFTAPGGHGTQFGIEANVVTTVAEVDARFAALLPRRPDAIKAILEHGGWGPVPVLPTLSAELLGAVAERARAAGLPLFVHVWSVEEARTAVERGARALAHGVYVGAVDGALASEMKRRGVAYVPTLAVMIGSRRAAGERSPYANELARAALSPELYANVSSGRGSAWSVGAEIGGGEAQWLANLRTLADAGVRIGTGTDAGNPLTPHGPALIEELALYVEAGLSPARALRAATLDSAGILGLESDFGSLDPGKVADVVVVRGDPTRAIGELWHVADVFKAGRRVDREALARRWRERAAPEPRLRVGVERPALVDDFDDGDAASDWGPAWRIATDEVAGGKSGAKLAARDGVLRVDGELRAGFAYGPFAGVALAFDAGGERVADATAFEGLRLRARGTQRSWTITVERAAVKDFDVFAAGLEVGPEWKELDVRFADLAQNGFGEPVRWGAEDLTGLAISARAPWGTNEIGEFWLELDRVEFYRAR